MDLLHLPARFLAGPAAALLDVDADHLRADLAGPVLDELDLGARHMTRFVVWWLLGALLVPVAIGLRMLTALLHPSPPLVSAVAWGAVLFALWMGIVHAAKAMIAYFLPEGRWSPSGRFSRFTMLAQTPDIVVALTVTVLLEVLVVV